MRLLAFVAAAALAGCAAAPSRSPHERAERDVRAVLAAQVDAWNRGDVDGFMAGYWASDDLTFLSGTTLTRGHAPTLARYKSRYKPGAMGTLEFKEIDVHPLSGDSAFVIGRYELAGTAVQRGAFTLVLRRIDGVFRVVHDHTSAEN